MSKSPQKSAKGSHSLATRILALAMSALVASGVLVYLIMLLMDIFG